MMKIGLLTFGKLPSAIEEAKAKKPADLEKLLRGNEVWSIN
jgi:hypothetical protein